MKMDLKNTFVSSHPNRRLAHLAEKEATLKNKITKTKLNLSQKSGRSYRSNSQQEGVNLHLKLSRGVIEASDLVQRMVEADPEKTKQL